MPHFSRIKNLLSKKYIKVPLLSLLGLIVLFFILNLLFPLKVNIRYSQIITADDGSVIHAFLTPDQKWRMKSELNDISPILKKAIIQKEDKWFYQHFGVNPFAICRALVMNIFSSRRTSGASTITMQVARMLQPKRRSYANKLVEIFRALQLEMSYTKDEILQLYFNLVPYGGNIEGVKAASILYFGKLPNFLSIAQVATLTVIPNRPNTMKPGGNDSMLTEYRNKWLLRLKTENIFSEKEIEDALKEPLNAKRKSPPQSAPHFSYWLRSKFPNEPIIQSTLNKLRQGQVEELVKNYSRRIRSYGIFNAAILVVDNRNQKVLAYLGSPDFTDKDHAGQVDGVQAIRSPGSTLKPLVYALCFDRGLLTPKTVMTDVPSNFDGFEPENFNSRFNGKVTVETALSHSLNIPAVKALNMIGTGTMIDRMKLAGFNQVQLDEKKLGLSLVLGGCGVNLFQLAGLYSSFPRAGNYTSLKVLKSDTSKQTIQLVSKESAYMIGEILTQLVRPDLPNNYQSSMHLPKVAWKTGTSYGRRDAWSVGYNKNYTIAVWIGNFTGEGVAELTGADMATPLLFDLFSTIDNNSQADWLRGPKELGFRTVCSETGLPPGEYCENQISDYFIPGVSSNKKCEHLKEVYVSADEKFSYCTTCKPEAGYKKKLYENFEPELLAFYDKEKIIYKKIPPHNPNCTRVFSDNPPKITSPVSGKEYLLEKGQSQQLMLQCQAAADVQNVYWYVNDRFLKSAPANEKVFFIPPGGKVKISCSDDKGRNSNLTILVGEF